MNRLFWLALCWLTMASSAYAGDRRVALLLGHQRGWTGEEYLHHTLTGDINPLEKALSSVGFQVVKVVNQSPSIVRKVFAEIAAQKKIDTFLFYYSGHAGPKAFHLGPQKKGEAPLSYKEFRRFFGHKIKSSRRIAVIDACFGSRLLRMFKRSRIRLKGPRRKVKRNLLQVLQPMVGQSRGVQVIVSSQIHAFEDQRRKASIFTYYLLQGIRGKRVADADQDGMITVAEMFRYAGKRFQRETGEEPSFFDYTIKGVTPYGLVPAYNSFLYVDAKISGRLFVSVRNFVWSRNKPKGRSYRIRVVAGRGEIHLRRGKQCFLQKLNFPKDRQVRLTDNWRTTSCDDKWLHKKGLTMPAALAIDDEPSWSLSFLPGYTGSLSDIRAAHAFSFDMGLRWRDMVGFGLQVLQGATRNTVASEGTWLGITRLALQTELGYMHSFHPVAHLWIGGYALCGALLQHASTGTAAAFFLAGGLQLQLSFQLHRRIRLLIAGRTGIQWLAVTQGNGLSFQFHGATGLAFSL